MKKYLPWIKLQLGSDENKTDLIQKEGIDVLNFATINYIDKCECGIENGSGIVIPM